MTRAPAALEPSPLESVAARLGALLARAPHERPRLEALAPAAPPARVAAIDGSSVVLGETGAFLVGAYRAGVVSATSGSAPIARAPDPTVVLLEPERLEVDLARRLQRAGHEGRPRSPEDALHLLREIAETEAALDALESLEAGDLLLLDGPAQSRPFPTLARRLVDRARERGVDVVGVCKSTSLTLGGVPALAACHLAAAEERLDRWCAELPPPSVALGRVFVATLSPAERRAFRFDVVAHDGDARRALARLPPLARHPAYPGYPAALALAHNAVKIAEDARLRLLARLEEAAERHGVKGSAWRAAFEDYHDVLDLGA